MRRLAWLMMGCAALSACVTTRSAPAPTAWALRMAQLQGSTAWQLEGRTAVTVGTQGWQASLNWSQDGPSTELHLAGPLGVGALSLRSTPAGLSMNGAPPSDAVLLQLQDRLGFDLPLQNLRYWLLGVPDPDAPAAELTRNPQDRAQRLVQEGWTLDYDRYLATGADLLPGHLVMSRENVRVKIAVEHWSNVR